MYEFADRVKNLQPSAIREIFKFASDPTVISLAAGNPAVEAFPAWEVAEITAAIMRDNPIDALQYSVTEGYPKLRQRLKAFMSERFDSFKDGDELIITAGAQQVMELSAKALCNEGDTIICESPSFIGSLNSFRSYNVNLCGIPMENDGINVEKLEAALKTEKNVRFIYVIPNFQNPSGVCMSWEKRKAVYALAKKYGTLVLEDNPYGDIRVEGESVPTIKSLDEDGIVIYAGSFSKVLAPGLRVGYCIAPSPVCAKIIVCKQTQDVHTNILAQIIADKFMSDYDFDAHIEKIRGIYRTRLNLMHDLLKEYMPPNIVWQKPQGGLFFWCDFPASDSLRFAKAAIGHKVAIVPGNAFLVDEAQACSAFRLNFSTPTAEKMAEGIEILGKAVKEYA